MLSVLFTRKMWNKGQCLLVLLPALVFAIPYGSKVDELYSNDDYDKEYENGGDKEEVAVMGTPEFVSEPKKAMVNEGDTLRLPCIVDRLEGFVLLWKKNTDIITVGSQIINKADSRIKLEEEQNGNYLVISLAEEADGGEYVCQISAYKPTELKHSVEIRVEPVIKLTPESGLLTVKEGDSATLQCDITAGNPTPEIIWRRRERMMPNGEEEIAGSIISFNQVNRHHSGHYICSADNGFGPQAVTAEIKLDVQHKPTVEQEQTFIHTGAGDQTEVVCVVHASPHAKVTWLHNGQPIDTGNSLVNQRGNKHTLMLVDINEESFGKYTCKAKNELGEDERTTEISGKAHEATIKSESQSSHASQYKLEWTAKSKSPITVFKIQYKLKNDATWKESEVAASSLEDNFYVGHHEFKNLKSAAIYEVRIASENQFGYNSYGKEFEFATKGAVYPVQSQSVSSAPSSLWKSSALVVVSVLTLFVAMA